MFDEHTERLIEIAVMVDGFNNPRFADSLTAELFEILGRSAEDILECAYPEGPDGDYYPEDEDDAAEYIRESTLERWLDDAVSVLPDGYEIVVDADDSYFPVVRWISASGGE